jgi:hypothetical protein
MMSAWHSSTAVKAARVSDCQIAAHTGPCGVSTGMKRGVNRTIGSLHTSTQLFYAETALHSTTCGFARQPSFVLEL